ncbi:MAG TPA: hypothetical protein VGK73_22245, partial [Polyangiaceae bacterium]
RPSGRRGIVVERPQVPLSRVIVADVVGAALEHLIVLAELASELGLSERRGVKALFTGPPGTGKTLSERGDSPDNRTRLTNPACLFGAGGGYRRQLAVSAPVKLSSPLPLSLP